METITVILCVFSEKKIMIPVSNYRLFKVKIKNKKKHFYFLVAILARGKRKRFIELWMPPRYFVLVVYKTSR